MQLVQFVIIFDSAVRRENYHLSANRSICIAGMTKRAMVCGYEIYRCMHDCIELYI